MIEKTEYWKNRKLGKRGQGEYPLTTKAVGYSPRQRPKRLSKKLRITTPADTEVDK